MARPCAWTPVEWDGEEERELLAKDGLSVGRFNGADVIPVNVNAPDESGRRNVVMVADIVGNFRDEVVVVGPIGDVHLTVSI